LGEKLPRKGGGVAGGGKTSSRAGNKRPKERIPRVRGGKMELSKGEGEPPQPVRECERIVGEESFKKQFRTIS